MKRNVVRRSLAWLLVLVMALSAVPFGVFAESAEQVSNAGQEEAPGGAVSPVEPQQEEPKPEEPKPEEPKVQQDIQDEDTQVEAAQKCLCEDTAKCTEDFVNEECPVCAEKDADLEKVCKGKTQEQLNAEAEAKKAEEEAEKKAAEEAAQKASEEAVKNVQKLIDALPEADAITEGNREAVEAALNAIDDAKERLTDEERGKLDFTRYDAAAEALNALDGMPGAGAPVTLEESFPTKEKLVNSLVLTNEHSSWGPTGVRLQETAPGSGILTATVMSNCYSIMIRISGQDWSWGRSSESPNELVPGTGIYPSFPNFETGEKNTLIIVDIRNYNQENGTGMVVYFAPFTVTFESIGGSAVSAIQTGADGKLTALPIPTRESYTFDGWYLNDQYTGNKVDTSYTYTANTTLYAKWTPITYTVTFNPNGGTLKTGQASVTATYGTAIGESDIPKPERTGYRLVGWSKNENLTEKDLDEGKINELLDDTKLINLAEKEGEEVTLYAVWYRLYRMDTDSVIRFDPTKNDSLLQRIPKYMRYLGISSEVTDAEDLLKQLADKGKLKLEDLDFGDNKRYTKAVNVCLYKDGTDPILDLGEDSRFTFEIDLNEGWPVGNVCGYNLHGIDDIYDLDVCYADQETRNRIKLSNIRYFSPFVVYVTPYVIKFDSQGGSAVSDMKAGTDGKLATMPANPTKTGYTFDGWYLKKDGTGTRVDETYQFSGDTTVYAKWIPNSYTVTFHANYGSTDTTATQNFTYDMSQALNCGSTIQRDYYKITGWAETKDGEKKYDVNETVKNLSAEPNGNKDLYALWEYVPYTVTFNANGVDNNNNPTKGTVTEDGTDKDEVKRKTQETPINTLKTLPVPNAQDGYYFEGWYYKDKNDKNKEKLVKVGDTVFTENTEVYAKWTVFEPVTVTLKCQRGNMTINGKTVTTTTMKTKWPGVIDGTLPTAARSGYKFDGWYTAAGVKVTEDTVFLRDTTIYARFTSAVSRTGNPKTGDQAMLGAAVAVLVVAAVGLGAAVVLNKKKK